MRIMRNMGGSEIIIFWFTAILRTSLVASSNQTLSFDLKPFSFSHITMPKAEPKRKKRSKIQEVIRKETAMGLVPVDCCPSNEEMIQPVGGVNQQGLYMQLYRDGNNAQRFIEYSCRPGVVNKPCRFLNRRVRAQSRCVQQYTYTYAIVLKPDSKGGEKPEYIQESTNNDTITLDYIRIRRGCSCEISPKPKKSSLHISPSGDTKI